MTMMWNSVRPPYRTAFRSLIVAAVVLCGLFWPAPAQAEDDAALGAQAAQACRDNGSGIQAAVADIRVVCLYGDITKDLAAAFKVIPLLPDMIVVVSSRRGDDIAAMEIGWALFPLHPFVVVDGHCLRPCSNSLFLAGDRKLILDGAFLSWNGGAAPSWPGNRASLPSAPVSLLGVRPEMHETVRREARLLTMAGVNRDMLYIDPFPQKRKLSTRRGSGWVYNSFEMKCFGVLGIVTPWPAALAEVTTAPDCKDVIKVTAKPTAERPR